MVCDKECKGKMCASGKTCSCGCGCGWASGHRVFRVVLGIVIALLIFWLGVKVGEFGTGFGGYGGYSMHRAYPMMQSGGRFYGPSTLPPSTGAVPAGTSTQAQ